MIPLKFAGVSDVESLDRSQRRLFPECLDDWIDEDNPVRVIDVFVGGPRSGRASVLRGENNHESDHVDRIGYRDRSRFHRIIVCELFHPNIF